MPALRLLFNPIVFAIGFLTPLFDQSLTALGVSVTGVSNLVIAFAVALTVGAVAHIRGGWLWHTSK